MQGAQNSVHGPRTLCMVLCDVHAMVHNLCHSNLPLFVTKIVGEVLPAVVLWEDSLLV